MSYDTTIRMEGRAKLLNRQHLIRERFNHKAEVMSLENLKSPTKFESKVEETRSSKEPTLLEKAIAYRQKNSEKWQNREKDREETFQKSYGIYEEDSFLNSYYKRIDEIAIEKRIAEEKRKSKSPQINLQIQFNKIRRDSMLSGSSLDSFEYSIRRDSVGSAAQSESDPNGELDIFEKPPSHSRKLGSEVKTEMLLKITKAKYLLNWLGSDNKKYKTCTIKCLLFPKSVQTGNKLKTRATYVNLRGTARYHHTFKIHGFTENELSQKHVILEVTGKNDERKEKIGRVCLSGIKAQIAESNSNRRGPTPDEYEPWQEALERPGKAVHAKLSIHRTNEDFFSGGTNTALSRSQLAANEQSEKMKWSRRTPVKKSK